MADATQQLFVVGCPRSGTTLLRNLLHGHPEIALTCHESHFVPRLLSSYGKEPDFHTPTEIRTFLAGQVRPDVNTAQERKEFCPTDSELTEASLATTWKGVLQGIFNLYCDKDMRKARVWGDKRKGLREGHRFSLGSFLDSVAVR